MIMITNTVTLLPDTPAAEAAAPEDRSVAVRDRRVKVKILIEERNHEKNIKNIRKKNTRRRNINIIAIALTAGAGVAPGPGTGLGTGLGILVRDRKTV